MSFLEIVYNLFIGPLQLVFEIIFAIANRITGHPGIAIIALSLIMNFLVLPLYRRADAMQEEARDIELKLQKGVAHIKKSFSGDERMMILQTYYRQNNYKPTDVLNGSVSLLLEIPFFIAAYQFLSHLEVLKGVALGPIKDLGAADGLLVVGGIAINCLPILMTVINIVSSALYLKEFPLKTKIQLYSMAIFFFVFLYTSPAGLVFYWTLNNLFSLFKNIFYKLKEPGKVLEILFSTVGFCILGYIAIGNADLTLKQTVCVLGSGLLLQMPLILRILKSKQIGKGFVKENVCCDKKIFLSGSIFLTVFVGVLIPSAVIVASPAEFIDIYNYYNSLWYLVGSGSMAIGIFIIWLGVFYWLANDKGKVIFDKIVWILCGVVVVNYMFFGTKMGLLQNNLQYEEEMIWGFRHEISNFFVILLVVVGMYVFVRIAAKYIVNVLLVLSIVVVCMAGINTWEINRANTDLKTKLEQQAMEEEPSFQLSKSGKNVIVLMLDRAMNQFVPYIFNEKPELKEQFAGFTYYSNTMSYGHSTNYATPSLFGGYEYIPEEINKRDTESLVSKHNEALKVMPSIFDRQGYKVTVCDPPYAGYGYVPDLSIYDDLPNVKSYITQGRYKNSQVQKAEIEAEIKNNQRNFFCYGLMKSMPLLLQELLYDEGRYNQVDVKKDRLYETQVIESLSVSEGISSLFMNQYNVLLKLPEISQITDEEVNTFVMLENSTTHEPILLQEPQYEPVLYVDNTEYDAVNQDRFLVDGKKLTVENSLQMSHYHVNMATFIQLGKWFNYMRENDVYDNTRIILVSDHGRALQMLQDSILDVGNDTIVDLEYYYPLLMMKDFDSQEFVVSEEFMTNADVPTMAMATLIENPQNPYTGKVIGNTVKTLGEHYVVAFGDWSIATNNGNVFSPSQWVRFSGDNVWDKDSWEFISEKTVLPYSNK